MEASCDSCPAVLTDGAEAGTHEGETGHRVTLEGYELRDTAVTISYAAGGRYAVELRLDRTGRLFGRYTGPHRNDPSPWEERVADLEDAEHVRTVEAARWLLEAYGAAEQV